MNTLTFAKCIGVLTVLGLLTACAGGGTSAPTLTLTSIAITPASVTVANGTTANLIATGTYSDSTTADITTSVTWTSAAPATASVGSNTGVVTGNAAGTTTVTAALNGITSPTAGITVTTATLVSIAITPASATIAQGSTVAFTAITSGITLTSSNTGVATFNGGVATGLTLGTSVIGTTGTGIPQNHPILTVDASIGGTMTYFSTFPYTLVLQNNLGDNLTLTDGDVGPFTFATPVPNGSTYRVTFFKKPLGTAVRCTLGNGSGTVAGANITNVVVNCTCTRTLLLCNP
jgi:hypothetical protein